MEKKLRRETINYKNRNSKRGYERIIITNLETIQQP